MPDDLDSLLALRHDVQRIHDCLREQPSLALAAYLASMLVMALAEHIADAAAAEAPPRTTRRH
ncbi:hypothetical protein [Ancylobacter sp. IITR112]|uniref:hypothetical protein n=1 Tax=Ancylobacter sp. IITR112 TaxID=3138073 RepID=UPI00352B2833